MWQKNGFTLSSERMVFMKLISENYTPSLNGSKKSKTKNGVLLTKREIEVLVLVVEGLTTQEIAEKTYVSINTVETHRRNIIQKLKSRNIASAVAKAFRMHLIR